MWSSTFFHHSFNLQLQTFPIILGDSPVFTPLFLPGTLSPLPHGNNSPGNVLMWTAKIETAISQDRLVFKAPSTHAMVAELLAYINRMFGSYSSLNPEVTITTTDKNWSLISADRHWVMYVTYVMNATIGLMNIC